MSHSDRQHTTHPQSGLFPHSVSFYLLTAPLLGKDKCGAKEEGIFAAYGWETGISPKFGMGYSVRYDITFNLKTVH